MGGIVSSKKSNDEDGEKNEEDTTVKDESAVNQETDLHTDPAPWATFGHALLNTKEFLFVQ